MVEKRSYLVFEVIDKVAETKAKKDKVALLKQHDSTALRSLLRATYDDSLQFNLPKGNPPYTESSENSFPSNLHIQVKRLPKFIGTVKEGIDRINVESQFISMLESVHPREAELLCLMKDKKSIPGVTKAVVKEAFPNLIPE